MPLSVPLLLVPGEPGRHYTVHLHRVRWDTVAVGPLTGDFLAQLEAQAREGLRFVSECVAAKLADADVEATMYPDGSATAVARVLCTEDICAAVAEKYRRDADEDVEAEAARRWATTQLQGHTIELLKMRGELDKNPPGKTTTSARDMLTAVLAVQQERTGGTADRIVLMLDEAAHLLRDNTLFTDTDRSPEGARREIDRLIRQNRAPYPPERRWGKTAPWDLGIMPEPRRSADTRVTPASAKVAEAVALPGWADAAKARLDRLNASSMAPEHLVRETEMLARSVAAGETHTLGVRRLAELCGELARRHDAESHPLDCGDTGDDALHDLMHRIGYRPRAMPADEVRAAGVVPGPATPLRTLPEPLPDDGDALVLVYLRGTPGIGLLDALLSGSEDALQGAVDGTLMLLANDSTGPVG